MVTKLQRLNTSRRNLEVKEKDLNKLHAEVVRNSIDAIFEALGIKSRAELNYNNHHARGVTVSLTNSKDGFEVSAKINGVHIETYVKDETSSRLQTFKILAACKEVDK